MPDLFYIKSNGILAYADGKPLPEGALKKLMNALLKSMKEPGPKAEPKPKKEMVPLKERKAVFYLEIMKYKKNNPNSFPYTIYEQFFKYWSETNGKEQMRRETVEFFEIGKRLSTFWGNLTTAEKNAQWTKHHNDIPNPQQKLIS